MQFLLSLQWLQLVPRQVAATTLHFIFMSKTPEFEIQSNFIQPVNYLNFCSLSRHWWKTRLSARFRIEILLYLTFQYYFEILYNLAHSVNHVYVLCFLRLFSSLPMRCTKYYFFRDIMHVHTKTDERTIHSQQGVL